MNKTLKITCTAMLTALSVVANVFTVPIGHNNAISFTFVICCITGIYFGIVPAITVGFVGDLIAHFIHPIGAYNWFIALSSLLVGLICALSYKLKIHKLLKLLVATILYFVICTCFLNTFGLWLQYIVGVDPSPIGLWQFFGMDKTGIEKSFWAYLIGRAPYQLINTAVNVVIVATLQQTRALDKLFEKIQTAQTSKAKSDKQQTNDAKSDNSQQTSKAKSDNSQQTSKAKSDKQQTNDAKSDNSQQTSKAKSDNSQQDNDSENNDKN